MGGRGMGGGWGGEEGGEGVNVEEFETVREKEEGMFSLSSNPTPGREDRWC